MENFITFKYLHTKVKRVMREAKLISWETVLLVSQSTRSSVVWKKLRLYQLDITALLYLAYHFTVMPSRPRQAVSTHLEPTLPHFLAPTIMILLVNCWKKPQKHCHLTCFSAQSHIMRSFAYMICPVAMRPQVPLVYVTKCSPTFHPGVSAVHIQPCMEGKLLQLPRE
jgi:hypothetical protein